MVSSFIYKVLDVRQRLWVRPLLFCAGAFVALALATLGNAYERPDVLSPVTPDMIEMLLKIISTSMLAVATFAVGSLVSAYASASAQATPRAFQLLVSDDSSKNALSSFIGAFIFSIVALVALRLNFYRDGGLVTLFALTMAIFTWVVLTFVSWLDQIARLGRLSTIITKAEDAAENVMRENFEMAHGGGVPPNSRKPLQGQAVHPTEIGFIQNIDLAKLQKIAKDQDCAFDVVVMAGDFTRHDQPLVRASVQSLDEDTQQLIRDTFTVGVSRNVARDPRFGLIILSEIASRGLSPAVNDPGTAIVIIGRMVRLLSLRLELMSKADDKVEYDRLVIEAPKTEDVIIDAFRAISRDGASQVEVLIHLQKGLQSLATYGDGSYHDAARDMAKSVVKRAQVAMTHDDDVAAVKTAAGHLLDH